MVDLKFLLWIDEQVHLSNNYVQNQTKLVFLSGDCEIWVYVWNMSPGEWHEY